MNKFLVAVILLLLAIIAVGSLIAWKLLFSAPQVVVNEIAPTPVPSISTQSAQIKKITYVKDNSLWMINSDGTNKKQLTESSNSTIPIIGWKSKNEVTFARCTLTCQLVTKNIDTGSETVEVEHPQIMALDWDSSGKQLSYIYRLPDGQMKLDLKNGEVVNTIKNFFAGPGRGGSLDDNVSVYFSPDDKYLLVTNTLTVGNPQEKVTVWLLEAETGKIVEGLIAAENGWPTQARWDQEKRDFTFKSGVLFKKIDSMGRSVGSYFNPDNFYNPTPVLDSDLQSKYLYWSEPTGEEFLPTVGVFDKSDYTEIIKGFYKPESLEGSSVVALKAKKYEGEEGIFPFVTAGLATINTDTKEVNDLDTGEINLFAISP